jgi:hypothetical protein
MSVHPLVPGGSLTTKLEIPDDRGRVSTRRHVGGFVIGGFGA